MTKAILYSLLVISIGAAGYRRAGFGFTKGENHIEGVSQEAGDVINNDPFLTVREVNGESYSEVNGEEAAQIDLSEVPENLLPIIQAMLHGHQEKTLKLNAKKVPDIAELEEAIKWTEGSETKLTAALRDEAWAIAEDLLSSDEASSEEDAKEEGAE